MNINLIETVENFGIPEEQDQRKRFKIKDKSQAIWALRKIAQDWRNDEHEKIQRDINFFEFLLYEYFLALREEDPKLKTLPLPHGKLKMRAQQPLYLFEDEDHLIAWAKENLPDAVEEKPTLIKNVLKKHIKESGEIPPGVQIEDRPEKFSVEVVD